MKLTTAILCACASTMGAAFACDDHHGACAIEDWRWSTVDAMDAIALDGVATCDEGEIALRIYEGEDGKFLGAKTAFVRQHVFEAEILNVGDPSSVAIKYSIEPNPDSESQPALTSPETEPEAIPAFQVLEEKNHSVGNLRSRVSLEMVAPQAEDDSAAISAMMAAAIDQHRKTWPDAVWVNLWSSPEMEPPIKNRIVFALDGCGWAGTDCSQPLWTDLKVGEVPVELADWGKPSDQERKEAKDIICRQSLQCWGDKHNTAASFACKPLIEAFAIYDYQWTDGFFGVKLPRFRWDNQAEGTISYTGDKIKFQNALGAWKKITYWCSYDPNTETATAFVLE